MRMRTALGLGRAVPSSVGSSIWALLLVTGCGASVSPPSRAGQLDGSLLVFTQKLPHWSVPDPQLTEQAPFEQTRPDSHCAPHAPQLFGSFDVSVHCPEHEACPAPQLLPASMNASNCVPESFAAKVPTLAVEPHP